MNPKLSRGEFLKSDLIGKVVLEAVSTSMLSKPVGVVIMKGHPQAIRGTHAP